MRILKQGKGEETFKLPGDKKSVVNEPKAVSAATVFTIWLCRWLSSSCSSVVWLRALAGLASSRSGASPQTHAAWAPRRCAA